MRELGAIINQNSYLWMGGLMLVLMIIAFAILHTVRKTNRTIQQMKKKVEEYLKVILDDTEEEKVTKNTSLQEEQMRRTIEHKRRQQEEAVFESVLQEIFP